MRIIGLVMLFAVSAFAQVTPAVATAACGPEKVSFNVKLDESQHALAQPEPGKAWVYFIQEKGSDALGVTTMIGLDGTWVGANKNSSYFGLSVGPGKHHVCRMCSPIGVIPWASCISPRSQERFITSMRESFTEKQPTRTCFLLRSTATRPSI